MVADETGVNRHPGSVTPFPCIRARKFLVVEQSVKNLTIPSIRSKANPNIASYRQRDIRRGHFLRLSLRKDI